MISGRLTRSRLLSMLVLPVLLALLTVLMLRPLGLVWGRLLTGLSSFLQLPGGVGWSSVTIGTLFSVRVPFLTTAAGIPGTTEFALVGGLCAAVLLGSMFLPERFLPLRYFLRFATLVQLTAFLAFAVRPDSFPYLLPQYTLGFLEAGCAVLVLVPLVLGLTYFPFDITLGRKVGLVVLAVGHLAILLPFQVALHAWVVYHLSLLVLPTMFFIWGLLVEVFVFVALYGWAMSWPDAPRDPDAVALPAAPAQPGGATA
jgi:hypothetical protein